MKRDFAALRFAEDGNISDRVYWYLAEFPVKEGERVLAPVGVHDRLQCAVVERTLCAEEENAPYDMSLLKRIASREGARKLTLCGQELLEFGGVKYDKKHFTRFGKAVLAREEPAPALFVYGFRLLRGPVDGALFEALAAADECAVLFGEEGKAAFERLYSFARGKEEALTALGTTEETCFRLKEKLL